ncbi:MAG: M14 family zinc carboxypeptidase [Bacteroidota bacterium]
MRKPKFNLSLCSFLLLLLSLGTAVLGAQESPIIYSEVAVELTDEVSVEQLEASGVDLDHFHPVMGTNTLVIPRSELSLLSATGLPFTVTEPDLASAIEARNIAQIGKYQVDPAMKTTAGFELGSMGGFYTYAEVLQQMDEMFSLYPNLITQRFSIGTTIEGRTIWAVKISDNPNTDESTAEAPVYFDALHHAREPGSMATVINFMFHMLENYNTDAGIEYLIDNREIFIVPVVNPDGYEYNRQTNPNGGGLWRKNRRVNSGSSCRGVDLNRNYDSDFGGQGTSSNPCSNSYRGTSAFSEPESQAIRDFTTSIGAPIAYTTHTSGGYWLGPDFSDGRADFAIHAELNSDCMDENEYAYGDANLILGYAAGTTQGWMYEDLGTLSWTPEIGTTGFWPAPSEIISLVNQQIKPYEYACWVAGARADLQDFAVTSAQGLSTAAPLELDVRIKNTGLSRTAQNVSVTITPDNAGVTAVSGTQSYGNIASRAFATNATPFSFTVDPSVPVGTVVTFTVSVSQEGVESDSDFFQLAVGQPNVLFSDDAEGGTGAWSNGGSGTTWQTSDEDSYSGANCFVDSRLGHTSTNNSRTFTTTNGISLAGTSNPRLEFVAKWGLFTTVDYVRLQVSVNGGSWANLSTASTETVNGGPAFRENEPWTFQSVDLSAYAGQSVRFRFASFSNGSLRTDGFYFDDFRVVDYTAPPVCGVTGSIVSETCDGNNTVTTADDSYTITVSATVTNGSGAYDVLVNGSEVVANVTSGTATSFPVAASGGTVAISFRDATDNGCTSGTLTSGALSSCSPTCNDGIQNGNETGVDCGGPDCAACPTCNDGIQNGNETGVDCGGPDCSACPTTGLQFEQGTIAAVGSSWISVPLNNSYTSMVVVATPVLPNNGTAPVVTRVRNASGSAFELRVQNPSDAAIGNYDVHYLVVEEGVYTQANDGVKLEAVKLVDNVTSRKNGWSLQARTYQQAYSSPVIVGQVMTANDADWSVFWTASATSRTNPPSSSSFSAGKHVGEDPDIGRAAETIGYVVVEAGTGDIQGTEYAAGIGSDIVRGPQNSSTGYTYGLSGLTGASAAVASAAALDGGDGGWPVLYGGNPFTTNQVVLSFDEDQAGDSERSHTTEQVAYLAFGASAGAGNCSDGIQNGSETGVDCGGPDCAPCATCNDGIQNGSETGVDCGGPDCAACPTCSDGIQNGSETGVDCGGPDCAACPVNYCSSSANSTQFEHIASITIGGVTNTTDDDNGYGDYTGTTPIPMGGTVSFSMTPGFSGSAYTEGWVVWIDYNADGDFTDAGELALQVSGSSTVTGTVTVPGGLSGTSRMRIQMRYNAFNGSSCGTYPEGEVEDYTVDFSGGAKTFGGQEMVIFQPKPFPVGKVLLFPNPVSTELTIVVPGLERGGEGHVWRIVDAAGREVATGNTTAGEFAGGYRLSVAPLPAGMYYFSLPTVDRKITKRFIVSKRR